MPLFPGFLSAIRLKRDAVPDFDHYPFSIPVVTELDLPTGMSAIKVQHRFSDRLCGRLP